MVSLWDIEVSKTGLNPAIDARDIHLPSPALNPQVSREPQATQPTVPGHPLALSPQFASPELRHPDPIISPSNSNSVTPNRASHFHQAV